MPRKNLLQKRATEWMKKKIRECKPRKVQKIAFVMNMTIINFQRSFRQKSTQITLPVVSLVYMYLIGLSPVLETHSSGPKYRGLENPRDSRFTPRPKYSGLENPPDSGSALRDQNPAVEKIRGIWVHSKTKIPRSRKSAGFRVHSETKIPQTCGIWVHSEIKIPRTCGIRVHSKTKLSARSTVLKGRDMHKL
jgi:hypothetical protein